MAAFLFTCPITRMKVQHWLDDDEDASEDDYEGSPAKLAQACTSSTGWAKQQARPAPLDRPAVTLERT